MTGRTRRRLGMVIIMISPEELAEEITSEID
jgi:hypothetical protein